MSDRVAVIDSYGDSVMRVIELERERDRLIALMMLGQVVIAAFVNGWEPGKSLETWMRWTDEYEERYLRPKVDAR